MTYNVDDDPRHIPDFIPEEDLDLMRQVTEQIMSEIDLLATAAKVLDTDGWAHIAATLLRDLEAAKSMQARTKDMNEFHYYRGQVYALERLIELKRRVVEKIDQLEAQLRAAEGER